jgi:fermentation-respiration switch protein FrsA (DUF1100 family)
MLMPRNIASAIHKAVTAKLREQGVPAAAANTLAQSHAASALKTFNAALGAHGAPNESAYEQAFVAVAQWAKTLRK